MRYSMIAIYDTIVTNPHTFIIINFFFLRANRFAIDTTINRDDAIARRTRRTDSPRDSDVFRCVGTPGSVIKHFLKYVIASSATAITTCSPMMMSRARIRWRLLVQKRASIRETIKIHVYTTHLTLNAVYRAEMLIVSHQDSGEAV